MESMKSMIQGDTAEMARLVFSTCPGDLGAGSQRQSATENEESALDLASLRLKIWTSSLQLITVGSYASLLTLSLSGLVCRYPTTNLAFSGIVLVRRGVSATRFQIGGHRFAAFARRSTMAFSFLNPLLARVPFLSNRLAL